ncbi:MAG TPA: hypothetical protein PK993_00720 [Clostridia bacterium]|nr:hypothetical protein [Clostridia bacterium]
MKKNSIFKLFCILIILTISLVFLLNYKYTLKKIEDKPLEVVENGTVLTENSYYFFEKYGKGIINSKEYNDTISKFYKISFPKYYKDLLNQSENQTSEYYEKNKENIYNDLTINNKKDFLDLIKFMRNIKGNELILRSIKIDQNNIISRTDYTMAKIDVLYENNKEISMIIKVFKKDQGTEKNIIFLLNK